MPCIDLDVCCLNRPFDDQRQDRIRLAAEAVLLILGRCEVGAWQWVSSAVDDRGLRIATRHIAQLQVRVANPLDWLLGWGNYTEERYQWLGNPDLEALGKKIQAHHPDQEN